MNKHQGEPRYFTAPEWIGKDEKPLTIWPINRKSGRHSRAASAGTNRGKGLLRKLDAGLLKKGA